MASIQQYLEKQDTALLESLLAAYCDGREDMHTGVALTICMILSRRNPGKPDVIGAFRQFCAQWLP